MNNTGWCIGLDLSLASSSSSRIGIAAAPLDWDCETKRVRFSEVAYPYKVRTGNDNDKADRLAFLASATVLAATGLCCGEPIVCWGIESVPSHGAFAIGPLAELHGAIKVLLRTSAPKHNLLVCNQSYIRRLMMGGTPKDLKTVVTATVHSFPSFGSITDDQCDAFVVLNFVLSECGAPCLSASNSPTANSSSAPLASNGAPHSKGESAPSAARDYVRDTLPSPPVLPRPRSKRDTLRSR